ncbi:hypothetical protein NDU88_005871 [Pleurodeles waltl]|uniref:Endonuclease/exonuclease/phosphatase domain-containing protein n=1 Tax=Pleurodeles waltl TaxID=8319 RepID=A0AAV7LMC8_PLEWA|nr:hypothetical protein NDU88_005871 [Pleurodeles waltl]
MHRQHPTSEGRPLRSTRGASGAQYRAHRLKPTPGPQHHWRHGFGSLATTWPRETALYFRSHGVALSSTTPGSPAAPVTVGPPGCVVEKRGLWALPWSLTACRTHSTATRSGGPRLPWQLWKEARVAPLASHQWWEEITRRSFSGVRPSWSQALSPLTIKFMTWNACGIAQQEKHRRVHAYLKHYKTSITFLQESLEWVDIRHILFWLCLRTIELDSSVGTLSPPQPHPGPRGTLCDSVWTLDGREICLINMYAPSNNCVDFLSTVTDCLPLFNSRYYPSR